jgi:hypothetical protein
MMKVVVMTMVTTKVVFMVKVVAMMKVVVMGVMVFIKYLCPWFLLLSMVTECWCTMCIANGSGDGKGEGVLHCGYHVKPWKCYRQNHRGFSR